MAACGGPYLPGCPSRCLDHLQLLLLLLLAGCPWPCAAGQRRLQAHEEVDPLGTRQPREAESRLGQCHELAQARAWRWQVRVLQLEPWRPCGSSLVWQPLPWRLPWHEAGGVQWGHEP